MDMMDLIARDRREKGLSCLNCSRLLLEYDLDAKGPGVWVCDAFSGYEHNVSFPFESDMPCFELSFWLSVFSENLRPNDERGYELAMADFENSRATPAQKLPLLEPCHDSGVRAAM